MLQPTGVLPCGSVDCLPAYLLEGPAPGLNGAAEGELSSPSGIYDGLYFVGAGTHPGAGVPGVLSSAKVLDKII